MADEQTNDTDTTTSSDDSTEGVTGTPDAGKVTFTSAQQEHIDSLIGTARRKGRDKATADHEKATAQATTKAEQAKLEEQAEWKMLAEQHEAKVAELETKLDSEQMRRAFYEQADEQGLLFVNPQARKDAYTLATLPDNADGMADAVKALTTSHPHLFGKATAGSNVNATETSNDKVTVTDEQVQAFATQMGVDPRYVNKEDVAKTLRR